LTGIGIVGSGFMGRTWAQVAHVHTDGARLVAVAGGRRAPTLAADFGCAVEGSPAALLRRSDVDAVVIATPPSAHLGLTRDAASQGKHVLVEKPMALGVQEAREMASACGDAGVTLAVVSQHRFRDSPRAAKKLIEEGGIGEIRMIQAFGPEAGWNMPDSWWTDDPHPPSAYSDWAAHACDVIRWLLQDEPTQAFARFTSFSTKPPPGQTAMVTYDFQRGALGHVWMTYNVPVAGLGSALQFVIIGSTGILQLDSYGKVRANRGKDWELVHEQTPFDPLDPMDELRLRAYAREMADFLGAARERREPLVSGTEGVATMQMLEAAERSAAEGRPVRIPVS
jgi:UDP-N-acetyl-2-amino-2-deoxyglucuronate dehydrogenase